MPLEKRIISIQFGQGLDQKTEPKITGKLTTADNAVLRQTGTIEKRPGFVAQGVWPPNVNPVRVFPFTTGQFVATDYNTDIMEVGGNIYGAFVQHVMTRNGQNWNFPSTLVPPFYSAKITTKAMQSELASSSTQADIAIANRSATQGGQAVCDVATGTAVTAEWHFDVDTQIISAPKDGTQPFSFPARTLSLTSSATSVVHIARSNNSSTQLRFSTELLNSSEAINSSITNAVAIAGIDPSALPQFDAVAWNNKIYFAAKGNSNTAIVLGWYDPSNGSTSTTTINASTTPDILTIASPDPAGTDRLRLFWTKNTASNTGFMASYSATLSQILAPTSITIGVPAYGPGLITQLGAAESQTGSLVTLFYTQSSTTALGPYTALNQAYNNSGTPQSLTAGTVGGLQNCTLATKPFIAHGQPYAFVNFNATGQQHFALVTPFSNNLVAVARCLFGVAGPNTSSSYNILPGVAQADNDVFYTVLRRASFFSSQNGAITAAYGYDLAELNFCQTQSIPYVQAAGSTFLGGGYLKHFDGINVIESGFLSSPVIVTVSATTSGGSLTSGVYSCVVVKEFVDASGRTHRSQPSLPITFTTSTTTSAAAVIFTDGPNFKSLATIRAGQIRYTVFRTQGNGSIYYRDAPKTFGLGNGVDNILGGSPMSLTPATVSLTVSDAVVSGGDILYTQGGSLPNWTPDSVEALCEHQSRLFCNDSYDTGVTRYSKQFNAGDGVAFALANVIPHPSEGGRVTAYASMDSTLVGFKARMIFAIVGNGPDDTGLNGTFSDGQIVFHDIGAINQRNVCRMSAGVVFKSPDKGFYLLTRDLQLQFIGADVQNYNSKTVVSSEVVALAEANGPAEECRFLCSDGTLLIWNYTNGQWTTASLPGCVDAVQTGGRYVVVNTSTTATNARVFQQSMSTYTDDYAAPGSVTYGMTIETGWIKTNDMSGFQRIWDVMLLGTSQGPGKISVEVGYDYEAAYNEIHTASMSSLTSINYPGAAESPPEMHLSPVRQKCQAIRFRVKDIPDPGNTTGVFKLTDISLECGVKSGRFRLPASKDG